MKKNMILMIVVFLRINAAAFSEESRFSMGFDYGNFFEKRTDAGIDIETYMGSPGIGMDFLHLWDTVGIFHTHSFLFPNNVRSNEDGYTYYFQYQFVIGPAFRLAFSEKLDMTLGAGFSFGPTLGEQNDSPLTLINMGISGDIGCSYFVTETVYIHIGSVFSYHFSNVTKTGTGSYTNDGEEIKKKKWSDNYNLAGARPYIRIGILMKKGLLDKALVLPEL